MPDFTMADILGAQTGAPGPVYEGSPDLNALRLGDVLSAISGRLGIPAGETRNAAGDVVFPTNPLERGLQQSDTSATQIAAAVMPPGAPKGPGIRAYHGSPYDFEKFDLSKIGTGEGAQAYGHGLYFAENPAVAREYRKNLSPYQWSDASEVSNLLPDTYRGSNDAARRILDDVLKFKGEPKDYLNEFDVQKDLIPAYQKAIDTVANKGKMYEVNINAKPEQFLQWDAPLGQQSQAIQDFASQYPKAAANTFAYGEVQSPRGQEIYKRITANNPSGITSGIPQDMRTSMAMNEAGIPGIRYLDQGSRVNAPRPVWKSSGDVWQVDTGPNSPQFKTQAEAQAFADNLLKNTSQTSNYVVFNPDIVDIRKKWALLLAAMGGAGAGGLTPGGVLQAQSPTQ